MYEETQKQQQKNRSEGVKRICQGDPLRENTGLRSPLHVFGNKKKY